MRYTYSGFIGELKSVKRKREEIELDKMVQLGVRDFHEYVCEKNHIYSKLKSNC